MSSDLETSACHVTFVSVANPTSRDPLSGYSRRILSDSDAVMTLTFGGPLGDFARRSKAKRVVTLSDYRKLNSEDEKALFSAANRDISLLGLHLDDVRVSHVEIGAAWAIGLRSPIFRELYAAYTLDKLLSEGVKTLTILSNAVSIVEHAFIARLLDLQRENKIVLNGIAQLKTGNMAVQTVGAVSDVRSALNERLQNKLTFPTPFNQETLTGEMTAIIGEHPSLAHVLIMQFSDNPMFLENIPPILDSLQKQKIPAAMLIAGPFSMDLYEGRNLGEKRNINRINSRLEIKDAEQVDRLRGYIRERIEILALEPVPLMSWVALFASHNVSYMTRSLTRLINFQAAFNVMAGRTRASSLYMTQSPDTSALAYIAVSACGLRMRPFYSFSAFLTQDSRSLPFVSPATLLAGGQHEIDILATRNPEAAEHAILTGIPSFDRLATTLENSESFKDQKDSKRPVISVITSRSDPDEEDKWLARLIRWADKEEVDLIFNKTQRKGTKPYTKLKNIAKAKGWERVDFITKREDVEAALIMSNIVITDQPSLAYAAVMAGTMIIQTAFDETEVLSLERGVGFVAATETELTTLLDSLLLEDSYMSAEMAYSREAFMSRFGAEKDDSAADRVVEALTETDDKLVFESPFLELLMPQRFDQKTLSIVKSAKFLG